MDPVHILTFPIPALVTSFLTTSTRLQGHHKPASQPSTLPISVFLTCLTKAIKTTRTGFNVLS
ncbi:hypothetical protein E2C01_086585 [Portunus trituberculatus]|uniref:Uncharacterized protein n=1 Tax=Portunus trituberculatus TaxID=210409 RepID=A0A5B7J452_PORTR|nr:hypothetical protein [Portunus trituberculatus]